MFLLTSRRDQSSVNWVATGDVQPPPFFLLIQIFGNNSWNRINFRCRNTIFTPAPMVPNSWWGRKSPEGPEACRCAVEIISLRQFVWNLYSARVEADIGISFYLLMLIFWFEQCIPAYGFLQDMNSKAIQCRSRNILHMLDLKPQSKPQKVYGRCRINSTMSRLCHYCFEKNATISLHIRFWGEIHPAKPTTEINEDTIRYLVRPHFLWSGLIIW